MSRSSSHVVPSRGLRRRLGKVGAMSVTILDISMPKAWIPGACRRAHSVSLLDEGPQEDTARPVRWTGMISIDHGPYRDHDHHDVLALTHRSLGQDLLQEEEKVLAEIVLGAGDDVAPVTAAIAVTRATAATAIEAVAQVGVGARSGLLVMGGNRR
jgi:hypothetical protein